MEIDTEMARWAVTLAFGGETRPPKTSADFAAVEAALASLRASEAAGLADWQAWPIAVEAAEAAARRSEGR